jgi:hypothetical protein
MVISNTFLNFVVVVMIFLERNKTMSFDLSQLRNQVMTATIVNETSGVSQADLSKSVKPRPINYFCLIIAMILVVQLILHAISYAWWTMDSTITDLLESQRPKLYSFFQGIGIIYIVLYVIIIIIYCLMVAPPSVETIVKNLNKMKVQALKKFKGFA